VSATKAGNRRERERKREKEKKKERNILVARGGSQEGATEHRKL
jgi:hypothetical protein